ncbi:hypothetical protein SDC9_155587 [bioreactor metagenome]|uniref:Outer membrane protein beta-barrel domain-containing protein n=1 Tax=bioreactor metagenome TaxID=1076179 RepID=A0A645F1X0_9ZZZZ
MQKVFDWWKLDANYSAYYAVVDASNIGINSKNAYNWNARLNSTMNIDKLFDIVVTANYRSKMLRVQGEADPSWNLDLALKYNLTSNMYINLRVQDIFNTDQRKWYESIPNVLYSEVNEKRNSRSISLGFTYKFNDYKFKRDRQIDDGRMNEGEE